MSPATEILVVGYGNDCRGDDALGPHLARLVASLNLPGVRALACPQLFPELSEPIAAARKVIFVDADADADQVRCSPLSPADRLEPLGHLSHPGSLLALARAIFGRCPQAWMLTLPGNDFEVGAPLSMAAQAALQPALHRIRQLCQA